MNGIFRNRSHRISHTRTTEVSKVSVLCGGDGDGGDGTLDMDVEGFYFTYLIVL